MTPADRRYGMYLGFVEAIIPPGDPRSVSKYQYEYQVLTTFDSYCQVPCRAIMLDAFGSYTDYEDKLLGIGNRVFVQFPRGDITMGIIIGGSRIFAAPADPTLGHHWSRRYNEVVQTVYSTGSWEIKSLNGPVIRIDKTKITIDDAGGESIVFDAANKIMTINANAMTVKVVGDVNVVAQGNVNVNGTNITLGANAVEAALKGNTLVNIFNSHIHTGNMGAPTTPPLSPMDPALSKKNNLE